VDPFGLRQVIIGYRPGPNGQPVPIVHDTETGRNTIGFQDTYIDPFTYFARSSAAKACEVAADVKDLAVDAAVAAGEKIAESRGWKVAAKGLRVFGYFTDLIFPSSISKDQDRR